MEKAVLTKVVPTDMTDWKCCHPKEHGRGNAQKVTLELSWEKHDLSGICLWNSCGLQGHEGWPQDGNISAAPLAF